MNAGLRAVNPWQVVVIQDHALLIVVVKFHLVSVL